MAQARRRVQQKAETRRLILDAAYELFEEKGYDQTTMRELAARAGVALGTIFQHFPDKSSLLVAAFQVDLDAVVERAFATVPEGHLREQLLHFARLFYEFYAQRPALSRVLLEEILFLKGQGGETLAGLVLDFFQRLGVHFQAAVDRGELPRELNVMTAILAFWSFYFTCLLGGLKGPTFDVDPQLTMLGSLLDQHLFFTNRERSEP